MPQYCSVPSCKCKGGFRYPLNPVLRHAWICAVNRETDDPKKKKAPGKQGLWVPGPYDVVCRLHFVNNDFKPAGLLGERRRLKDGAIPSIFPNRQVKKERRKLVRQPLQSAQRAHDIPSCPSIGCEVEVGHQEERQEEAMETEVGKLATQTADVQCSLLTNNFCIERYKDNPSAIHFYTGFDHYVHFCFFYNILGPAVDHLDYKPDKLSSENQLFMTLIKIRRGHEDEELGILFEIDRQIVSKVVVTWINFMYFQLKEINIWPSKDVILDHLPKGFKGNKYEDTRVILDATEMPIQKPGNVNDQSSTFSKYKHRNTVKTIIGCTPRGLVSYISDTYGGSTSDRQIIERSELANAEGFFSRGDSIMADRGILVQDLFASKDVALNTPTMLKGASQLPSATVVKDRVCSSKRVHVERVIAYGKTYKFLKKEMSPYRVPLAQRVIYVSYMLSNFRRSIVNRLC